MEILIAQHAGFCEGVERAYRIALEQTQAGKPVFMLGNLVHNTQVVKKFVQAGAKIVNSLDEILQGSKGILLISAHGAAPSIYEKAKGLGLEIVDTTCPWVKKAQKIAKELADAGYLVIIVGDKGHKEVQGLVGWSGGKAVVIENLDDINAASIPPNQKVGVLAQTTQSRRHFISMAAELKKIAPALHEFDTICRATAKRQEAAVKLAEKVALMLVIGDKMSANTKRLTELCQQTGTATHQIQTAEELIVGWLAGKQKIGITAGASTPEWVIKAVVAKLA